MDVRSYLGQLERQENRIKQKKENLKYLKFRAFNISSPSISFDNIKSTNTPTSAKFENNIDSCMLIEEEILKETFELIFNRHTIISQIHSMDNAKYINILFKRYVEYKRLDEVAEEMGYTHQYVVLLHGKALSEFEKVVEDSRQSG